VKDVLEGRSFSFALLRSKHMQRRPYMFEVLDPAALADFCLILLMFVIINSQYVIRWPAVSLNLPVVSMADTVPFSAMVVTITSEGLIFFNDEMIPKDGLADALRRKAFGQEAPVVLIEADDQVRQVDIMGIINAARQAGIVDVAMAVRLQHTVEIPPRPFVSP